MNINPKKLVSNHFSKKKPLGIISDVVFVVFVVLMLIPSTRKEVSAFLIRTISFPASTLDAEDQYVIQSRSANWQLVDLSGNKTQFAELTNKPVFLNIWATWCPPCIAELPSIQDLHNDYGDKINFILVSDESPAVVNKFLSENGYDGMPFYLSATVPADFSSQSIPATFILGTDGRVMVSKKGAARWNSDKTRNLLDQLIEKSSS